MPKAVRKLPWYIENVNVHNDLGIPIVKNKLEEGRWKYLFQLGDHTNPRGLQSLS